MQVELSQVGYCELTTKVRVRVEFSSFVGIFFGKHPFLNQIIVVFLFFLKKLFEDLFFLRKKSLVKFYYKAVKFYYKANLSASCEAMRADEYPCESASSRVRIRLGNHPYRPYFYFMEYGMVAKWAFLSPNSKNEHNLKPLGKIFEDPLCPTFLGIIGHNLEIEGILRKFHYAPHFLGIIRHNFNSLYILYVNFHFLTKK